MFMASPRKGLLVGTVAVSGETIADAGVGTATAGVRFNATGTVDANVTGSYSQIDAATDWIKPNTTADGTYDVRATLVSGNSPSGSALATWLALSSAREWYLTAGPGDSFACQLTIEIRKDGGAALASGTYNLSAAASP